MLLCLRPFKVNGISIDGCADSHRVLDPFGFQIPFHLFKFMYELVLVVLIAAPIEINGNPHASHVLPHSSACYILYIIQGIMQPLQIFHFGLSLGDILPLFYTIIESPCFL